MTTQISSHEQNAIDFAVKYGITLKVGKPTYKLHFHDDKEMRYVFPCTLKREGEVYKFKFGQSIVAWDEKPSYYDIFSCLQKHDPESFENFCAEYGYELWDDVRPAYNRKSMKVYKAVVKEWEAVDRLFGDILDELSEIS